MSDPYNSNTALSDFYLTFKSFESWPLQPHTRKICRVLILDSSFNPPTKAHSGLLETSLLHHPPDFFSASLLLLSTKNVDKALTGANVQQRIDMMRLMALNYSHSAVGVTSHGKFIDKAQAIQTWWPYPVQLELHFIMGYDTLIRLMDPKYYLPVPLIEALGPFLETCRLICADRGQQQDVRFWQNVHQAFGAQSVERIHLDPDLERLSSTMARNNIKNRQSLEGILCSSIIKFIDENSIY